MIIFAKFSTITAKANTYKITDLEISQPYDNNFNKDVVIDKAFKKAFERIILKITTLKENEIEYLTNLKTIYSLVESFSIVDEKFIDNKYISTFEVEFNKKQLFGYLEKKKILLFSENIFYVNWNKFNEKHFLLNYILPNEDIEDINLIKKNAHNIEEYDFKEIISKYVINDYIILILFQKENSINALIKTNLNNKKFISNTKFDSYQNQSIENIIKELKFEFENQWKQLNVINISIKLPITLSISSKNHNLIRDLEKKLYELDLVANFYIDTFSNEKIIYKIIYNSTPDKFINEFANSDMKLNTSDSIWSIE